MKNQSPAYAELEAEISKLKEELEREKLFNSALMENTPDNIYFKDRESRFLRTNKTQSLLFGFENNNDLIGKSDFDFFSDKHAQTAFQNEQQIIQTGIPILNFLERETLADGSVIWFTSSKMPFRNENGEIIGTFGFSKDITDHQQTKLAFQESTDKFATLFESMTEMIVIHEVVFDAQGDPVNYLITECNDAFTKITGIPKEAAVGKLANMVYGTEEPPYLKEFAAVAQTGVPFQYETYFAPMDKDFSISVVSPGKNKFATITTDITDVKKHQQIIASKNKELEQIVYVASHDLRSPLVNVDGYSRELEYSIAEIKKSLENPNVDIAEVAKTLKSELPEIADSLAHIRNSTRQMDLLLKGLLKLSRSGRASLKIDVIDMDKLAKQVASSFEFQCKETNVKLSIGELLPCKGDAVQLTQVLANLIGNALKYTSPERQTAIEISGTLKGNMCEYCVRDNGIGIAPEHQEKIFELFHRLDPSQTEGEGLGLTIVRQILSRLNGDIRVESKKGEGSRFYVSLPFAFQSRGNKEKLREEMREEDK
jgi:PAS domain S-box-containing protein